MSGEFTTWTALRTAIKDAIAAHVAGSPCIGQYTVGGKGQAAMEFKYRSFDELLGLLEKTYKMEQIENIGTVQNRVAYGRFRRFD